MIYRYCWLVKLYITLAVNEVDECGLSNTVHHESLTEDKVEAILATEEDVLTMPSIKTECFSKWVSERVVTHLNEG